MGRAPVAQERWWRNSARIKLVSLFQVQLCWYLIDVEIRFCMDAKHFAVFFHVSASPFQKGW
jgi:hypothetical protein